MSTKTTTKTTTKPMSPRDIRRIAVKLNIGGSSASAITALANCVEMGIEPNAPIAAALEAHRAARAAAETHRQALAQRHPLDLLDADFMEKVRANKLADTLEVDTKATIRALLEAAGERVAARVIAQREHLFAELEKIYTQRYDELLGMDDPKYPAVILAQRHDFAAALHRAHYQLLLLGGPNAVGMGCELGYNEEFWLHHVWTEEQWQEAVRVTGPAMRLDRHRDIWHLAHSIGARPRLARSYQEAKKLHAQCREVIAQRRIVASHEASASGQAARSIRRELARAAKQAEQDKAAEA